MTSPQKPAAASAPRDQNGPSPIQQFLESGSAGKVYLRNLPWNTTEDELKKWLAPAGKAVNALIPKFGDRSRGYGFVAFATQAEADKAIADFNEKTLGDRKILVKPAVLKTDEERQETAEERQKKRPPQKKPTKAPSAAPLEKTEKPREVKTEKKAAKPRVADSVRVQDFDTTRSIFVGNLPWAITEEELQSIFAEYSISKALIPRTGYKRSKSKGYGLVEFPTRESMLQVLKDLEEVVVNDRTLVIQEARPYRPKE